jgi:hypothetical protein
MAGRFGIYSQKPHLSCQTSDLGENTSVSYSSRFCHRWFCHCLFPPSSRTPLPHPKTIDAVVRGEDVPRLQLRRKDDPELKDLANKINDLFALIKDLRISKAKNSPSANS